VTVADRPLGYEEAWRPIGSSPKAMASVRFTVASSNGEGQGMHCTCLRCGDMLFTSFGSTGAMNEAKRFHREAHARGRRVGGSPDVEREQEEG
jgi:hypothetical protein